jgi:hypothetical protein
MNDHVNVGPCHVMARPRDVDEGDGLQIPRTAADILTKQSRIADKGWFSGLGGCASSQTLAVRNQLVLKCYAAPRTWTDFCNDLNNINRIRVLVN